MLTRALLALALLAAPLAAQTTFSTGRVETVYTGGPRVARSGLVKPKGTSGTGYAMSDVTGVVGLWDLGRQDSLIKGGYTFTATSSQFHSRTNTTLPCVSGGVPIYPFSVVIWFRTNTITTGGVGRYLWVASDGTTNNRLIVYQNDDDLHTFAAGSGASGQAQVAASLTANRWHLAIAVFTSAASRSIYIDTNTTGATETTSAACSGLDDLHVGTNVDASANFWDGRIAYTAVLPAGLSTDQRTAIFAMADPALVQSPGTTGAVWPFDNAVTDSSGNGFTLTSTNAPVANNNLLVVRDLSGSGCHLRATTSAPTWSSSIGNGQGGGVFTAASSQFLLNDSLPEAIPVAAPFQVYAVAQSNNTTANQSIFWLGDKDADGDFWALEFAGAVANDPSRWVSVDTSSGLANVNSYLADTNYLVWGLETSDTSREAQRNGSASGTDTTNLSPDNSDSMSIGAQRTATPGKPLDGEIHLTILLNHAGTGDQPRIETFTSGSFSLGIP